MALKKFYIVRIDGKRQRYSTTLRRLRKRGYVYNKKGRGWTKASPTTGGNFRPPPPVQPPVEEEFVEWTLFAKMDYGIENGARRGHEHFQEGSYTMILPKGVEPDKQFMLLQIAEARDRADLPIIDDLKFAGFERVPTRMNVGFGKAIIGAKQNKNGNIRNY